MKPVSFIFLILIFFSLHFGCFRPLPKEKQTLSIALSEEPPTLDPRKALDNISFELIRMCQDGLVRKNLQNECVPSLAKNIEISQDKLTYTFHLRDAYWSNGKKLTAFDFESTWKNSLAPNFPSPMAYLMFIIKNAKQAKLGNVPLEEVGIHASDENTLIVNLNHPSTYFLDLLTLPIFFPFPNEIANFQEKEHFISIGPFEITKWKHGSELLLRKNTNYWDANSVNLDKIKFAIIGNIDTELELFEQGNLDWIGNPFSTLPLDANKYLKRKGFSSLPVGGVYYYVFNTKFPFSNKNIRKGLSFAINRQVIVDYIAQMNQVPATSLISRLIPGSNTSLFPDGDAEIAKQYFEKGLQELGLTYETFPAITLSYNNFKMHNLVAQSIQEQWGKTFGIQVELKTKEWKVYIDDLIHKQFGIARCAEYALIEDPIIFLENYIHECGSNNFTGCIRTKSALRNLFTNWKMRNAGLGCKKLRKL
ncbi:MAG: peptide ABC transporter substrate-binding protein [Simkaniaceae bacterium]